MNGRRIALYMVLDILVWALVCWLIMGGTTDSARAWHLAWRFCRTMASGWGELGMHCEQKYWRAVQ